MHDRLVLGPAARRVLSLSGMVIFFSALLSLLLPGLASAHPALTYTCTNPHCYGKNSWWTNTGNVSSTYKYSGVSQFYGTWVNQNVVQITLPSNATDPNAKLNYETWLIDDNVTNLSSLTSPYHQCVMNDNSTSTNPNSYDTLSICWAETGYQKTNLSNSGHEVWFTSYVLPWDGFVPGTSLPHCGTLTPTWDQEGPCTYHNLYGPQLVSGDYATTGNEQVYFDATTAHQIDTFADSGYASGTAYSAQVSNVYMVPDLIQYGSELGGTTGVNGPIVHFTQGAYQDANNGTWWYHSIDGLLQSDNPPLAGWVTNKKPSQTTNGGTLNTCVYQNCSF